MPDKITTRPNARVSTGSDRVAAKESDVDVAKSVPAKTDDGSNQKSNTPGPTANSTNDTTENQIPTERPMNLRKFVPLIVLALAALILLGITGGWNSLIGSS